MEEKEGMSEEHEGGKTSTVERSVKGWMGRKRRVKERNDWRMNGLEDEWIDGRREMEGKG